MEPLHVLLLGASATDADQIMAELAMGGYELAVHRVETAGALRDALLGGRWDIVFVDPEPTAGLLDALTLIREHAPDVPVIIVSRTISPTEAAAAMRAGAADYLMPGDLARLAPAVARELRAAGERRARREAEAARQRSEARASTLLAKSFDGVALLDAEGRARYLSPAIQRILGYAPEELIGTGPLDVVHPADASLTVATLDDLLRRPGEDARILYRLRHRDGSYRWVEAHATNLLAEPSVGAVVLNLRDVSERMQAQEARNRLAAIVESSADAIIGLSGGGIVESWNAGAAALFGYTADEVVGRHVSFLAPRGARREQRRMLAAARRGLRRVDYETIRRHKDGRIVDVAVTLSPIVGETGAIMGVSIIMRDITARRQAYEALERARAVAEELNQRQSTFVATTSHELRTPLTVMVGYGELLRDRWGQLDDDRRLAFLHRMIAAAERQQRLVEDLLLLSQFDGGAPATTSADVALGELVERAVAEVLTTYRGQRVRLDGPADLLVRADPGRVVQIVANLLDNAAKYSPEGADVDAWWRAEDGQGVLRVRDRGPGVQDQHRDLLFSRFGRLPGSPVRAGRMGTGLGLYISRELARAMSGELDLERTGGHGSVFRLALPLAESPP